MQPSLVAPKKILIENRHQSVPSLHVHHTRAKSSGFLPGKTKIIMQGSTPQLGFLSGLNQHSTAPGSNEHGSGLFGNFATGPQSTFVT